MAFESEIMRELCAMAGKESVSDSLHELGMLSEGRADFSLTADKGWYRGGAETYCIDFAVHQPGASRRYIIKALVAFSPGTAPDHQLQTWVRRRDHLKSIGVPVCLMLGKGLGAFVENFLDFGIYEWKDLHSPDKVGLANLRADISEYCKILAESCYNPICILPNFRVQDGLPLWVDFGSDLGDPIGTKIAPEVLLNKLEREWPLHND